MPLLPPNPFRYGSPVTGESFFGRQVALRSVLNRVRNGESTAIVGDPHIGKSSFLLHLGNPLTLVDAFGEKKASAIILYLFNAHDLPDDFTYIDFWNEILEPLQAKPGNSSVSGLLHEAKKVKYERRSLEKIFNRLTKENRIFLLLLDEFDVLIGHAGFQDSTFFARLRKLSSLNGLVIVTASRMSLSSMNERGREFLKNGSPLFNTMIEVRLKPFTDGEIFNLLNQLGAAFDANQQALIQRMAGRHPYLLQAMASSFHENLSSPEDATENCYERISFHFKDIWDNLSERCQTTVVLLSLIELGGQVRGRAFSFGEIEDNEAFGTELKELSKRGLAEKAYRTDHWFFDKELFLVWRGEKWSVGTLLFAWWIRDQVILSKIPSPQDWIEAKEYVGLLLTREHWNELQDVWKSNSDWLVGGLKKLAQVIFTRLAR